MSKPLSGLLVIALEQAVAAPMASRRLADAGARVIKLERPEGDFARAYDKVAAGQSSYFVWLNRGKESVIADLGKAQDKALLEALLAKADVFIQNLKPGALAKLTVGDFDKRLKVLKVGQDKAGKDRRIKLPDVTATFFEDACRGKLPSAPLLARADGKAWNKDAWKGPVKDAALLAKLADAVGDGGTRAFDEGLLLALRAPGNSADPIGPKWFEEMMRDFTAMGSTGVLALMVLTIAGFLAMTRKGNAALFVLASVIGGVLISQSMKWAYARPRPELVPHGAEVYTASFPSGHSMMAAVVYLTLGVLLARTQTDRIVKAYIVAVAVIVTVLVGTSRVYLGVHWPTDVLAGWALGAAWALLCWLVMNWLQARGQVEAATAGKAK